MTAMETPSVSQWTVLLHGQAVGRLTNTRRPTSPATTSRKSPLGRPAAGTLQFAYAAEWLGHPAARPVSLQLPLQARPFDHWQTLAYFGGLLPYGMQRLQLAQSLQVPDDDWTSLLDAVAGDCPGAVSLQPQPAAMRRWVPATTQTNKSASVPSPAAQMQLPMFEEEPAMAEWPEGESLDATLLTACAHPLLADRADIRLCWSAGQTVLPVLAAHGGAASHHAFGIPGSGAASSHLLWLAKAGQDDTLQQQAFCLQLLQQMQLDVAPRQLHHLMDVTGMQQMRADRQLPPDAGTAACLHGESLRQALGWTPLPAGDTPAAARAGHGWPACFALLRSQAVPAAPEVLKLLDAVIAFVLLGDMQAGPHQLFLLHPQARREGCRLAPLHMVESALGPGAESRLANGSLACPIGPHRSGAVPPPAAWDRFAHECGLSPNQVRKRVRALSGLMMQQLPVLRETFSSRNASIAVLADRLQARAHAMAGPIGSGEQGSEPAFQRG